MSYNFNLPSIIYFYSDSQQEITSVNSSSSDQYFNFFKKYASSSPAETVLSKSNSFE